MISLHPAQRRAEQFDALVEGDWHDAVDMRTAELLELVGAVRSIPAPAARPEFVADLRERLMLAAETELVAAPVIDRADDVSRRLTVPQRRTPRERRLAVALGGFALVGATAGMAAAAQSALPGDALYPVKRAIENAEAGFHVSDDGKGSTILANASGRLDEVNALTRDGGGDAADITQTLNTFSDQATEAGDLLLADYENTGREDSIRELRDFTATSLGALTALDDVIPAEAEDSLIGAAQVLFTLDAAAANACPDCGGKGISEIPPQLLASAGQALDDAAAALGNNVQAAPAEPKPKPKPNGGKGNNTSGVNPPANPVAIPSESAGAPGNNGGPNGQPSVGVNVGNGGNGNGNGDTKGPKDLGPVKGAVDDVVEDVNNVLGGLGGLGGKQPGN